MVRVGKQSSGETRTMKTHRSTIKQFPAAASEILSPPDCFPIGFPPSGDSPSPAPRMSGTFAMLGISSRSPRVSEKSSGHSESLHSQSQGVRIKTSAVDKSRSSSLSSSPDSDRLTEGESFLRNWESDRVLMRDRLHERLY